MHEKEIIRLRRKRIQSGGIPLPRQLFQGKTEIWISSVVSNTRTDKSRQTQKWTDPSSCKYGQSKTIGGVIQQQIRVHERKTGSQSDPIHPFGYGEQGETGENRNQEYLWDVDLPPDQISRGKNSAIRSGRSIHQGIRSLSLYRNFTNEWKDFENILSTQHLHEFKNNCSSSN